MADTKTSSAVTPADARLVAVQNLFIRHHAYLRELAQADSTLNFEAAEKLSASVASRLHYYSGPQTDEAFQQWLRQVVLPALSFAAVYSECGDYVRASIRKVLLPCTDLGLTEGQFLDAEQETWVWAWEHLDELRAAGQRAKPKTRLYAVARFKALTIRKTLLRHRERLSDIAVKRVGTDPWGWPIIEPLPAADEAAFSPYERRETIGVSA
ncbi:MAG: hypothetical protein M3O02_03890 [Acidobacteriota bacterium]|nr:hypothetical protein [Acidobacteriota bacterium]